MFCWCNFQVFIIFCVLFWVSYFNSFHTIFVLVKCVVTFGEVLAGTVIPVGEREIIPESTLLPPETVCVKTDSGVSCLNVSLIVRGPISSLHKTQYVIGFKHPVNHNGYIKAIKASKGVPTSLIYIYPHTHTHLLKFLNIHWHLLKFILILLLAQQKPSCLFCIWVTWNRRTSIYSIWYGQ